MIVVDTNMLAALHLSASDRELAEAVLARDPFWSAPHLWRHELRNVLVTFVRQSRLSPACAETILSRVASLLRDREHPVDDEAVLRLALASGCTAYDCEFVALAQKFDVPLVTFDRQVLAAFPDVAIHPSQFASGSFWGDRVSEALAESYADVARPRQRKRPAA